MTPEEFAFEVLTDIQFTALKSGKPFFKSENDREDWGKSASEELKELERKTLAAIEQKKKQELIEVDPEEVFGDG